MALPDTGPEPAEHRRAGRPGGRRRAWFAGGALLVIVAVVAIFYWREPVAGAALRAWLDRSGYDDAELTVSDVTVSRLRLTDVRLGHELAIAEATIAFDLSRLFARPVTRLSLDGVRLDLTDPGGPLLRRLAQPGAGESGGITLRQALDAAAGLPAVSVSDLTAEIAMAGRPVTVSGTIDAGADEAGGYGGRFALRIAGSLRGEARALSVNGTLHLGKASSALEAALDAGNGAASGSLRLQADAVSGEAALAAALRLAIEDPDALLPLVPALAGASGSLRLAARTVEPVHLPLDTRLDRAGLRQALRQAGAGGIALEATVADGRHPAGLSAVNGTASAVARMAEKGAGAPQIEGQLALRAGEIAAGGTRLREAALEGPFRIELRDDAVVLVLPQPARLAAAELATADGALSAAPLTASLTGGRSHALRLASGTPPLPDLRLRLDVAALRLRTGARAERVVEIAPFVLRLAGTGDADGTLHLHLRIPGLSAAEGGRRAALDDIALSLREAGNSLTGNVAGRLTLQREGKPVVAPVAIRSDFALWRDILTFDGKAEALGSLVLSVHGRHDFIAGSGMAELALDGRFTPGQAELRRLAPGIPGPEIRAGTVSASAHIPWGADAPDGSAALRVDGMELVSGGVRVAGLSADIRLDRLAPPRTPPGQTLRARRITAGISLDDLALRFRLIVGGAPGRAAMRVEALTARFAGGALSVAPTVLDPAAETSRARIEVRDMDLAVLLGLLGFDGVSGTGQLSGAIPVVLSGGAVAIEDGRLAAAGPGVLRVRSEAAKSALAQGGEEVTLMLRALEDFRYESLTLEIDKAPAGEGSLVVRTRGLNPAVGGGQPFIINLNVAADMNRLAAVAAQVLRLPGTVLRSIVPGAP